jgi:hypothetical protein
LEVVVDKVNVGGKFWRTVFIEVNNKDDTLAIITVVNFPSSASTFDVSDPEGSATSISIISSHPNRSLFCASYVISSSVTFMILLLCPPLYEPAMHRLFFSSSTVQELCSEWVPNNTKQSEGLHTKFANILSCRASCTKVQVLRGRSSLLDTMMVSVV